MNEGEHMVLPPVRSVLFAPGNRPDVVAKLPRFKPDIAVIDLEDAVAIGQKAEARKIAVQTLLERDRDGGGQRRDSAQTPPGPSACHPVYVRVNPTRSSWFSEDVGAASRAGADGLVLPKTENLSDLAALAELLDRHGLSNMPVIAGLETAAGVARADELCCTACGVNLLAVYFGAEDYIADVGGQRTADGFEVLYARSRIAIAARLAGIAAIDQAVVEVRSAAAFEADARQGRALGYAGKLCVHPSQVSLSHAVFQPSDHEVERARAVLAAVNEGVSVIDGQMIDEAHARRARATLGRAAGRWPR